MQNQRCLVHLIPKNTNRCFYCEKQYILWFRQSEKNHIQCHWQHPYRLEVGFTVTGVLWYFGCRTLWALQISSTDNLSSCTRHTLEISPVCCLVGVPMDSFTFDVWVRWGVIGAAWVGFSIWGWSRRRLSGDLSVIWNVPFWEKSENNWSVV